MKRLSGLPIERVLQLIGGRWRPLLLWRLYERPMRPSELGRLFTGLSEKILHEQLKMMEDAGLIERHAGPQPGQVTYAATTVGASAKPAIEALVKFGREHGALMGETRADCRYSKQPRGRATPS